MLEGRGSILRVAREISDILREHHVDGAIVGGVAVVLHGHVRTTLDVDVYTPPPAQPFADALRENGFSFSSKRREFEREGVPVHLVTETQIPTPPKRTTTIDGILVPSLEDLINIKLRSGRDNLLRAQDLADVIGLIRAHALTGEFTSKIDKDLRPAFRELVRAMRKER